MIGHYLHASPAESLGKMGALVALADQDTKLEGKAADMALVIFIPVSTLGSSYTVIIDTGSHGISLVMLSVGRNWRARLPCMLLLHVLLPWTRQASHQKL